MTTFVQLHLLTAYPPANLNRDDTGRPKSCVFGGAPRMRVSSQSLKRAWRTSDVFESFFGNTLAKRTQRIGRLLCDRLIAGGFSEEKSAAISRSVASLVGAPTKKTDKDQTFTDQLVFLNPAEMAKFEEFSKTILSDEKLANELFASKGESEEPSVEEDDDAPRKSNKKGKGLSKKRKDELRAALMLKHDTAIDMAMFGRMLADSPDYNVDAAIQVAHALTTHKVIIEDDYYVAVDDLKKEIGVDDSGTAFIGVQEFASGLFYLYICIDTNLLARNLSGEKSLAADALEALVRSAATVAPKGKQTSFASRARASFVLAERGTQQPRSLAAAFLKPVGNSEAGGDQAAASIAKLRKFRADLDTAYGANADKTEEMSLGESGSLDAVVAFCRESIA
jgi:CRISPR system Cascade subunit CasC